MSHEAESADTHFSYVSPSMYEVVSEKAPAVRMSSLDQTVIALAGYDHRSSIKPSGAIGRFFQFLFGCQQNKSLADERLEALRRYAIIDRLDDSDHSGAEPALLLAAGFDAGQFEQIDRLIDLSKIALNTNAARH